MPLRYFFFFRLLIVLFIIIIITHQSVENERLKKKERKGERRANAPGNTVPVYGGARAGKHLNLTTFAWV